jgi:CRP-like cAMP-binding protein
MTANQELELIFKHLKKSRYLKKIDDHKLLKLANISRLQRFQKGSILLRQNEMNKEIYVILQGEVSVFVDGEFLYNMSRSGDVLGEMSVISGMPSNATVTATKDTDLVIVSSMILKNTHDSENHLLHSVMYQWFSNILSDKLNQTSQKAKLFETVNRHLKSDLADAKFIQEKIISAYTNPIHKFPLNVRCEFSNILGGDLYAVLPLDKTHYGILIGDVSGHGTGACLISMMILNLFHTISTGVDSSVDLVNNINKMSLQFMHHGKFVTAFYCVYETTSKTISYTNAGHHPALVLRGNKIIRLPVTSGIPIGIFSNTDSGYSQKSFTLKKNDRLLLFTDAIFEGIDGFNSSAGFNKITNFLQNHHKLTSKELIDHIYNFSTSSHKLFKKDDFTLMIFEQQ